MPLPLLDNYWSKKTTGKIGKSVLGVELLIVSGKAGYMLLAVSSFTVEFLNQTKRLQT